MVADSLFIGRHNLGSVGRDILFDCKENKNSINNRHL
jgi:hypothetical protein